MFTLFNCFYSENKFEDRMTECEHVSIVTDVCLTDKFDVFILQRTKTKFSMRKLNYLTNLTENIYISSEIIISCK